MADIPRPEYPRPQFERKAWINLNGPWTYTFDFGESGMAHARALYQSSGFDKEIPQDSKIFTLFPISTAPRSL